MGGGGGKQTTTESKTIQLPAWVDKASQANYQQAQQVANRPYDAYGGETVAGLDPLYYQARNALTSMDDMMAAYGNAGNALQGILGYNPQDINAPTLRAGQLSETDLAPYLNPYTNEVEQRAIANMERTGQGQQNQLASDATQKGAFGGSRQAMQQAIQGAETARGVGDLSAQLRKQGYDAATANALADIKARQEADTQTGTWRMTAQQESEKNRLQAQQNKTQAAQQLTSTADQYQKAQQNQIMMALGLGQISQEQAQREMDDLAGKWQKERDYPLEQLNILMSALGMSPYGHTETGTSTTKSSGGGGGLGGLLSGGMGLLQAFAGMSDRTEKTDIKKIGRDEGLDVPLYAYRYKGDPKTYPKVVGPMAQDLEKKHPQLVRKVAGKRVVDLTTLMRTA
jgi:hypothetical protein